MLGRLGDFQNDLHSLTVDYKIANWAENIRDGLYYKQKQIQFSFQDLLSLDENKREKFYTSFIRRD